MVYCLRFSAFNAVMIKNPPANAGNAREVCLIPGSGRSPGEGNGNPLQYSFLESFMDREPGRLQSTGSELDVTEQLSTHSDNAGVPGFGHTRCMEGPN